MKQTLHFKVDGEGLTDLVRQIYLYEDKDKAWKIIGSLGGITIEQAMAIFIGDKKLVNDSKNPDLLDFVDEKNKSWKKEFEEHVKYQVEKQRQDEVIVKYALELQSNYDNMGLEEAKNWIITSMKYKTTNPVEHAKREITLYTMAKVSSSLDKTEEVEEEQPKDDTLEKLQKEANLKIAKELFINKWTEKDPLARKATDELIKNFVHKEYSFIFEGHQYTFEDSARNQSLCPHCEHSAPDGEFWRHTDEGYIGYYNGFKDGNVAVCFECPECHEKFFYHYNRNYFLLRLEDQE